MNLSHLYKAGALTWEASFWRLCVAPLVGILLALSFGVRGEPLGVLFLLLATPVAVSSHVMVVAARRRRHAGCKYRCADHAVVTGDDYHRVLCAIAIFSYRTDSLKSSIA